MDDYQDEHHGHPVIAGLAAAAAVTTTRHLARAYLVRAAGEEAADAFFWKMRLKIRAGIGVLVTLIIVAFFVSYASLHAADGIALAAIIVALVLAWPPVLTMIGYASQQARYLKQCGSSYLR